MSRGSADLFGRSAALGRGRREKPQTLKNRSALAPRAVLNATNGVIRTEKERTAITVRIPRAGAQYE